MTELALGLRSRRAGREKRPQLSHLGDLVGGEDERRIAPGPANAFTKILTASLLVANRRIVAEGGDQFGDLRSEARLDFAAFGVGVLENVVEEAGGDHVIGVMRSLEGRGDLDWMQDEVGPIGASRLAGVPLRPELKRGPAEWQITGEGQVNRRHLDSGRGLRGRRVGGPAP